MLEGAVYVELRGTIIGQDGSPTEAHLEFTPTASFTIGTTRIVASPIKAMTNGVGSFSQQLLSTDEGDERWAWKMRVRTETIDEMRFLTLPGSVPVVDLADLGEEG